MIISFKNTIRLNNSLKYSNIEYKKINEKRSNKAIFGSKLDELQKFIVKYDLKNQAIMACQEALENSKKGFPEDFVKKFKTDIKNIKFDNHRCKFLKQQNGNIDVLSLLDLHKKDTGDTVATYYRCYDKQGVILEDWFEF